MNDDERCDSVIRAILQREGSREVYLRCKKRREHESKWHESWLKKWKSEQESGFLGRDDD